MKYGEWTLGQTEALINKVGGLDAAKRILSGAVKMVLEVVKHILDLSADPFIPENWKLEPGNHLKGKKEVELVRQGDDLYLDGKKLTFFLSTEQVGGKRIQGHKLRKELGDSKILNANVLDYLLAHPELIPDSWKKDENGNTRFIYFWGTIYSGSFGSPYVRCLCWSGNRWGWGYGWLGDDWSSSGPAVLASTT